MQVPPFEMISIFNFNFLFSKLVIAVCFGSMEVFLGSLFLILGHVPSGTRATNNMSQFEQIF
jgi:hypothetical protein